MPVFSWVRVLGPSSPWPSASLLFALRRARSWTVQSQPGASSWQKILPDFSALVPVTALFAVVALSAGICEEVVFRARLLDVLHGTAGLAGGTFVLAAALLFGLAHYYQSFSGILVTSLLDLVLCGLYVGTGDSVGH